MTTRPLGEHRPVLLRGGTALVGEDLAVRKFDTLLLDGGAVVGFDVDAPPDCVNVDIGGGWVIPGLIDAHVHLELTAAPAPFEQWETSQPERMAGLLRNGMVALAAGVLGVRDLGSVDSAVIDYGRMTASGRILGPRVVAAGRAVTMTGGHLWRYSRQADGPDEVRRAVREQIRAGASVIKVMATGGLTTPGEPGAPELGEDELAAAVTEARNAGLRVAAHAHATEGIRAAIRAGVATIEHGGLIGSDERAAMRAAGVSLVPTLSPVLRLPADGRVDVEVVTKTHRVRPAYVSNVRAAIAEGVPIVAGTDAGCAYNPVGGVADEVAAYVALGMDAGTALRCVTVDAARAVGLAGGGVVQEGGPADLVVVSTDPRVDIGALRSPRYVVRAGELLDLGALEAMIAALGGRDESRPMVDPGLVGPADSSNPEQEGGP